MKPAALTSANVDATTGALFQDPSSGVASSVLPRFQPGCRWATKSGAEMGLKDPAQLSAVGVAVEVAVVVVDVAMVVALVVVVVVVVVPVVVALPAVVVDIVRVVAVPGTHW